MSTYAAGFSVSKIENNPDNRQHLSIKEVAELTGASPDTVRRWISRGELRAYYFSKRMIRIDWNDVLAMRKEVNPATFAARSGGAK